MLSMPAIINSERRRWTRTRDLRRDSLRVENVKYLQLADSCVVDVTSPSPFTLRIRPLGSAADAHRATGNMIAAPADGRVLADTARACEIAFTCAMIAQGSIAS